MSNRVAKKQMVGRPSTQYLSMNMIDIDKRINDLTIELDRLYELKYSLTETPKNKNECSYIL